MKKKTHVKRTKKNKVGKNKKRNKLNISNFGDQGIVEKKKFKGKNDYRIEVGPDTNLYLIIH